MKNQEIINIIKEVIIDFENTPYIKIGVSNRHIHLSKEDLEILFGKNYELEIMKEMKQPGQYACIETVNIIGSKGSIKKVRILGPTRNKTQVEISISDSFKLGVKVPIRDSGDLTNAGEITIENPKNGIKIVRQAAIAAVRHIHMKPEFAEKFKLKDKQFVDIEAESLRPIIFKNVLVRISPSYEIEMHVDTDEANAALIKNGDIVKIVNN